MALLALAVAMVYTGLRCTFTGDLDVERLGPLARQIIALIGAIGHLTRAVAPMVVGFLGSAAVFTDPRRAGGLDAALRALGDRTVVAAGFAAYGVFCVADAATRRA